MSEFDKEAEREKLRQKFAKDEEKRKNTRRMSELLLKGATMTNHHCDRCGDPIFRHDDEEFCPTCGGDDAEEEAAVPDRDTEIQTEKKTLDEAQTPEARAAAREGTPSPPETPADAPKQPTPTPQEQSASAAQSLPAQSQQSATAAESAGDARADLQQALSTAARKAAAANDPHTAKAWLEASREAAEALAALDR